MRFIPALKGDKIFEKTPPVANPFRKYSYPAFSIVGPSVIGRVLASLYTGGYTVKQTFPVVIVGDNVGVAFILLLRNARLSLGASIASSRFAT
jgi:hypothetical protein